MHQISAATLKNDLKAIQSQSPLIHNITNLVTMNTVANCLLAAGASPLMAHAPEEMAEITAIANALVLNIGTLDRHWLKSMDDTQHLAREYQKPVILDPVGAGASRLRTESAHHMLNQGIDIIRANGSEIAALAGQLNLSKGVDSTTSSDSAVTIAQELAQTYQCHVVISGARDYICGPDSATVVSHGSFLQKYVTGMGCTATALIAAFAAVNADYSQACGHAMASLGIAAERAYDQCQGPGSFYYALLDQIYQLADRLPDQIACQTEAIHGAS